MTREEKRQRREQIIKDYQDGKTAREISEVYNITQNYVYVICKDYSNAINHKGYADILRQNNKLILKMRDAGKTVKEIADFFNVSIFAVKYYFETNGIKSREYRNTEAEAARRIFEKTNGQFEYVSGYTNKDAPVLVRCKVCGETFERTYHHLTTHCYGCPNCKALAKKQREKEKEIEAKRKRLEKEQLRIEREKVRAEKEAARERARLERLHFCPVCGTETDRPKYCSDQCMKKANNTNGELRRRNLIKTATVDKDITVDGLFRRDNGVCAICGRRCNWEDYTIREGVKVCGDWYPSIDHIKPLARGGLHSWDNIQLAHRRCNSQKGVR